MDRELLLTIENPDNTFLFADPHFDHTNIIRYCHRPFNTTEEMNKVLLDNYNAVIKDDSLVLFLGDMAFGRGSRASKWWLSQLKGDIIYFKGSHDEGMIPRDDNRVYDSAIVGCKGKVFHVIHDPLRLGTEPKLWVVHAHKHNRTLFVDKEHKRICVSVEKTDYKPICLSDILKEIN